MKIIVGEIEEKGREIEVILGFLVWLMVRRRTLVIDVEN